MNEFINIQSSKRNLLFTPGPVNVEESVRKAIAREDICHREKDFERLLLSIENKILQLFEIKQKDNYRAVVITGSGTSANESILSSVVGDKKILIVSNGEFGERLLEISNVYNKNTFHLSFPWGESLDECAIEDYVLANEIEVVALVHHETSSGMLNPLKSLGSIFKKINVKFIVDCVSSTGAEPIAMEANHITFCSNSSSKAIGSYPGLSFVVGKKSAFEELKNSPVKTVYLNLYKFYRFISESAQTPNTPAVPLFYALEQTLANILNEGVSNRYNSLLTKANLLRKGMTTLDLHFLIAQQNMCSILTTVKIPSHVAVKELRLLLAKKSIIIYEGKGCFKNKVFQVGNIGDLSFEDIKYFLISLKEVLQSFAIKPAFVKYKNAKSKLLLS
jgi:2-aminoethylphosphonate-pyruvate transaminase